MLWNIIVKINVTYYFTWSTRFYGGKYIYITMAVERNYKHLQVRIFKHVIYSIYSAFMKKKKKKNVLPFLVFYDTMIMSMEL